MTSFFTKTTDEIHDILNNLKDGSNGHDNIIIMVIIKCYFSGELIALS